MDKSSTGKQISDRQPFQERESRTNPKRYQRTRDLVLKKTLENPSKLKGDHMNEGQELVSKKVKEFLKELQTSPLSTQALVMIKKKIIVVTSKEYISGDYKKHLQSILDDIQTMNTEVGKINQKVTEFHKALETSQLPPEMKKPVIEHIDDYISEKLKRDDFRIHSQGILHKIETISETMRTEAGKINQKVTEFHKALETSQLSPEIKKLVIEHIDHFISERLILGNFKEHSQGILHKVETIRKTMDKVVSKANNGPEQIQKVLKTATLPDKLKVVINQYFDSERKRIQTSNKISTWEDWESLASDIEDIGKLVDMFRTKERVTLSEGLAQI